MRCLFCGKELALLKRWTSGGEFCSDAHRQQYQEEYTQLALNRLLQAKPEPKPKPKPEPEPEAPAKPTAAPVRAVESKPPPSLLPAPLPAAPVERSPEPQPEPEPVPQSRSRTLVEEDEAAPAEAGFFVEMPVPVMAAATATAVAEAEFSRHRTPLLPVCISENGSGKWSTELVAAGRIALTPNFRLTDYMARVREGKLEVREFTRSMPCVAFDLGTAGKTEIAERSEEPMDLLIFPQPPAASPGLWIEGERNFETAIEFGSMARMNFRTTGIEDNQSGEVDWVVPQVVPQVASPVEPEPAPRATPVRMVTEPPRPAPPPVTPVAVPAPSFLRSAAKPAVETVNEPAAAEAKTQNVPDPATRPLPVTLHGLAAGRGKPVQVFASAAAGGVDMQVPRSHALPLRPVMLLGAGAPAEVKEEAKPAKTESRKTSNRQDARSNNGKARKTEPQPETETKAASVAVKETGPERPAAAPEPEAPKLPGPPSKPYTSVDLDLPSLSLQTREGFWSRLPLAGKIGVAAVLALAIGGLIYALTQGTATAGSAGPHAVERSALSTAASGWINDWGSRQREISVLRPSLSLSDYRMEFEGQIDSKALGWVYRAKDDKNYYVNKLEIVKPALMLVRFAVINGQEQPRLQTPLTVALRSDATYKVRFEAMGNRFVTYVQGEKVDEWTDDRLKAGGVGWYSERGEHMSLKGALNVVPLEIRK